VITIACVLRSGGDFAMEHVEALRRGVAKHFPYPHDFRAIVDGDLQWKWAGWWSKLELFRPGLFSAPVLYFDLDTMIVGPLDFLAGWRGHFALLSDFYKPTRMQSGVMAWTPGQHTVRLWDRFVAKPDECMRKFRGDGEFIFATAEPTPLCLQDIAPGQIVSYKRDVRSTGCTPSGASVICFHGQPRPWETPLWKEYVQ